MVKLRGQEDAVEAQVIGTEADKDLAVLKIDPLSLQSPLQPVKLTSSAELQVGQSVLAIGAPFGLDWTLTSGIVSALGRDIGGAGGRPIRDCVQTDASINPGNSGGPLLDSRGRLVGVNTMIISAPFGGSVGVGFAVPSDTVERIVQQIITHGPNARPSLGLNVLPDQMRQQYARFVQQEELAGAMVAGVVPGGPAEELGLTPFALTSDWDVAPGDMITSINGRPIKRNEDLLCMVEEAEVGEPMSLTLMRGCDPARVEEVTVTPVRRQVLMASLEEMEAQASAQRSELAQQEAWKRMRIDW